jgi:peptide/nickel transport system substrate-binding protein
MTLAENLEVINLRAIAGEYDEQERHTDMSKLPVFLENQQRGGYRVRLDPALNGSDAAIHVNLSYAADPEVAKWLTNKDFRHALALGIDRDQLNETFWLGVGTPGSIAPSESMPQSPGPQYRKTWAVLDVKQANELLDKIGLTRKDGEGYRVRTDNGQRLRLELMTAGGAFMPYTQIADMIRSQARQISIQLDVKEVERSLSRARIEANEHHLYMGSNDGSELIFLYPRHVIPVEPTEAFMGPLFARWHATGGREGKEPPFPELKRAQELVRQAPTLKPEDQIKAAQEIWRLAVEEQWTIGLVGQSPSFMGVRIVKNTMVNVPDRQVNAQHARTPGSSHPATFAFKS